MPRLRRRFCWLKLLAMKPPPRLGEFPPQLRDPAQRQFEHLGDARRRFPGGQLLGDAAVTLRQRIEKRRDVDARRCEVSWCRPVILNQDLTPHTGFVIAAVQRLHPHAFAAAAIL